VIGLKVERFKIYKLIDGRDRLPHYVGLTRCLERRVHEHINGSGNNPDKDNWLADLASVGLAPIEEVIEEIDSTFQEALAREAYWIRTLRADGMPLTNKVSIDQEGRSNRHMQQQDNRLNFYNDTVSELLKNLAVRPNDKAKNKQEWVTSGMQVTRGTRQAYKILSAQFGVPMNVLVEQTLSSCIVFWEEQLRIWQQEGQK